MPLPRCLLALPLLLLALPVEPATRHHSTLLAEVEKQLTEAQHCLAGGDYSLAIAHTQVVLVGSEITVCVSDSDVPASERADADQAIRGALDAWQVALKQSVTFHQVTDPTQAQVVVRFEPSVRMQGEEVAGYADWKRTIRSSGIPATSIGEFSAEVRVRYLDLDHQPMTEPAMRHETMHEFGHLLGLEDSPRVGELMGPLEARHPVKGPDDAEIQAVLDLRQRANRIQDAARAQLTSKQL